MCPSAVEPVKYLTIPPPLHICSQHIPFFILLLSLYFSFQCYITDPSLCGTFCLHRYFFLCLGCSNLRVRGTSFFPTLVFTRLSPLSLFLPGFPFFLRPSFSVVVSLGTVIRSDRSLAENNKRHLLKSAMAA